MQLEMIIDYAIHSALEDINIMYYARSLKRQNVRHNSVRSESKILYVGSCS